MPPEEQQNTSLSPMSAAPEPQTSPPLSSAGMSSEPKKRNKKRILAIIAVVLVVIIGAGTVLGYTLYQNPDKAVYDAFSNAINSKSITMTGSFKALEKEAGSTKEEFAAQFSGAAEGAKATGTFTTAIDGKVYGGSFISTGNKTTYLKVKNVKDILTQIVGKDASEGQFKSFIALVDDKWIRLDGSSLDEVSKVYSKQQACYDTAIKAFHQSTVQRQQVANAFRDNPIFKTKANGEETLDGVETMRIILTQNRANYAGFIAALKKTEVFKALDKCSEGELAKSADASIEDYKPEKDNTTFELWISKWGHELKQVRITTTEDDGSSATVTIRPVFNKPVKIQAPTESVPLEKVVESFYQALFSGSGSFTFEPSTPLIVN